MSNFLALRISRQITKLSGGSWLVTSSKSSLQTFNDRFSSRFYGYQSSPPPQWVSRPFSSLPTDNYDSPLDEVLAPDAPCPIYGTAGRPPMRQRKFLECGLPEDLIRFHTTVWDKTLLAPFVHTREHRVALHVDLKDLPLDDVGKQILQQVVGHQRYDVKRNVLKMNAAHFPSRIENKRYLVRMLDKVVIACQRVAKSLPVEGWPEIGNKDDVKN